MHYHQTCKLVRVFILFCYALTVVVGCFDEDMGIVCVYEVCRPAWLLMYFFLPRVVNGDVCDKFW